MADSVQMPALGESVTEGTVTRWLKQVGDQVEVDEPLLEVSTDKVDTEIPSPVAGTLVEILVQEDETVDVGTDLARIGSADEASGGGEGGQSQAADDGDQGEASGDQGEASGDQGGGATEQPQESRQESAPAQDEGADSAPDASEQQAAQMPEEVTGEADSDASSPSGGEAETGTADQEPQAQDGGGGGGGQEVVMPALGESVTEGTVTRWLKQVGDQVEVDEPLLEVSTDKVDTEIPSPVAGTLNEILVQEDETVDVGTALARVGGDGGGGQSQAEPQQSAEHAEPEQAGQAEPEQAEPEQTEPEQAGQAEPEQAEPAEAKAPDGAGQGPEQEASASTQTAVVPEEPAQQENPVTPPQPSQAAQDKPEQTEAPGQAAERGASQPPPQSGGGGYLTPLVRKLAAEKGVDLAGLTGTGVGGRIRKEDVLEAAAKAEAERAEKERADKEKADKEKAEQEKSTAPAASSAPSGGAPEQAAVSPLRGTTEKASRLRQIIAERMVESLQSMAQLTTVVEVDVTKVARLRARAKADFTAREGVNLTFLPFFVLAATEALKAHPKVNGVLQGKEITYHGQENVGIAVDTERGLVVPVIRDAGDLNLAGIAKKIADLAGRTRENKATPDELSGATFTVTNTGSGGALFDTPIVPIGTSAILGTGAIVKRPVVATDEDGAEYIAIRSMCYLALSYDHRLVDGADASRFLQSVKKRIEEGDFESEVGL